MEVKERDIVFRKSVNKYRIPSTTYATFGLNRYPAKFIPQVVAYVLENYATPHMKVFDPFAGCGTVGAVCRLYGQDYELWDLNPLLKVYHDIAVLQHKEVDPQKIILDLKASKFEFLPKWSNFEYWYLDEFRPLLSKAWGFFHSLDDNNYIRSLLTIPLLRTSRIFSLDDVERQKLSSSPISESRIVALLTSDWEKTFYEILEQELRRAIRKIDEYSKLCPVATDSIIKGGIDALNNCLTEQKDILLTSPPYLQSQEYIRQAKMDLLWIGYSEERIKELSKLEIPYREVKPQTIKSQIYEISRNKINDERLKKIYDRYFWGVLGALSNLQKDVGSFLLLFVGRASVQGQPVLIDRIFAEHLSDFGWSHEITLIDKIATRRLFQYDKNPATNREEKRVRTKTENLVVLKRVR